MNKTRTVTLEFLRHGPPHNQLLSPLTQYLALCGNHSPATVTMPFEHNQLLVRLRALLYGDSERTRQLQLRDTAQIMAGVLSDVPGLIAELAERADEEAPLVHLRMILSSAELALLPFELANAPDGFPGAGQAITLQAQAPVCLTREVRRVGNLHFHWPRQPRILFIAASPGSVGPIPLEAHLLALRRVIDPWTEDYRHGDGDAKGETKADVDAPDASERNVTLEGILDPHLVVLPEASVRSIRETIAQGDFTHVHILAHGVRVPGEEEEHFGLALHNDRDPRKPDVIDGPRLATLLRSYCAGGSNRLATPAVVTLASCQSAQQGSVVGAGASVAHALHEGGIPLVVASQFPISFEASVLMAEVLYEGLLWGCDPRPLLNDLRWQMKSRIAQPHDWASLVAYAALPGNLDEQLLDVRIEQAKRAIDSALKFVDQVTDRIMREDLAGDASRQRHSAGWKTQMELARRKKNLAMKRLSKLLDAESGAEPSQHARIHGQLASAEKRDAKVSYVAGESGANDKTVQDALLRARDHYQESFQADPTQAWALVQKLSLDVILDGFDALDKDEWELGRLLSERNLQSDNRTQRAWALGNLVELHLLASKSDSAATERGEELALDHARQLAEIAGGTFELYSTRRQIERYTDWYAEYDSTSSLKPLAEKILERWPLEPLKKFL